jgi:Na+/citrate or Na+/malate symporter
MLLYIAFIILGYILPIPRVFIMKGMLDFVKPFLHLSR